MRAITAWKDGSWRAGGDEKNSKKKTGFHEVKAGGVCGWVREQASVNSWH